MDTNSIGKMLQRAGVAALLVALMGLLAAPLMSRASELQQGRVPRSITIPANGAVTLKVRGFCLDFGKPFPTEQTAAQKLADAKVRQALNYAVNKGYTDGNPGQVQQAIWFIRDGQWRDPNHTVGQEIVDNATVANNPNDAGTGTSLVDAVAGGQASVSARFTPQTADAFYGDGDAEVKNLTGNELQVYMPIGVVFAVGTGGGSFQDLAAFEIGEAAVQPTAQPTAQATLTQAPAPTLAPTEAPTQAPVPTEAPATTSTPMPAPTETPDAGGGDDALMALILLAATLGFSSIIAGMALRRSPSK